MKRQTSKTLHVLCLTLASGLFTVGLGRAQSPEMVAVELNHPALHYEGIRYLDVKPDLVRFSRFEPDLLEQGKPQLGFNPDKAKNTTGGVIAFRTDSQSVQLRFRPTADLNRGSEFAAFLDGQYTQSYRFNRNQQEMAIRLEGGQDGSSRLWELTLPSFSNPQLLAFEIEKGAVLESPRVGGRKVYVALGDSITHGTGQGSATHLTWPFILSRKLDYTLYNLAVGGSGVSMAAAQTLADFESIDLITVLIGYNDWNGEGDGVDEFRDQYVQMMEAIRASHPRTPVFYISPLFTWREVSNATGLPIEKFREVVRELVEELGQGDPNVHFIAGESVSSEKNLQPEGSKDVVHLTADGAALLAESLYPIVAAEPGYSVETTAGRVTLHNGTDIQVAVVPEAGGELSGFSVFFDGEWHELIYRALDYGGAKGWRGKAQLLWPATGVTLNRESQTQAYDLDGVEYAMPFHGFAKEYPWRLVGQEQTGEYASVTLELEDSDETRKYYPFDFRLQVQYRLGDGRLSLSYEVSSGAENHRAMPFSIGNHITFKAPLIAGSEPGSLMFENDFPDLLVRQADKTFSGEVNASPYRGTHALGELTRRSAASLGGLPGKATLTMIDRSGLRVQLAHEASKAPTSPAIQFNLWADAKDGFFSPEPWVGTQNSLNNDAGLIKLAPGESWQWRVDIIPDLKSSDEQTVQEETK